MVPILVAIIVTAIVGWAALRFDFKDLDSLVKSIYLFIKPDMADYIKTEVNEEPPKAFDAKMYTLLFCAFVIGYFLGVLVEIGFYE